ncbi:MAG TPA: Hsp20 family protein [Micromonosporaceae bacterium]
MNQPAEQLQVEPTADGWILAVHLPGVPADQVRVAAAGRELNINTGPTATQSDDSDGFSYRLMLPAEVDTDRVQAVLSDGILTVRMPRVQPRRPAPEAAVPDHLEVGVVGDAQLPPAEPGQPPLPERASAS